MPALHAAVAGLIAALPSHVDEHLAPPRGPGTSLRADRIATVGEARRCDGRAGHWCVKEFLSPEKPRAALPGRGSALY